MCVDDVGCLDERPDGAECLHRPLDRHLVPRDTGRLTQNRKRGRGARHRDVETKGREALGEESYMPADSARGLADDKQKANVRISHV
jgi:hypothetical protein